MSASPRRAGLRGIVRIGWIVVWAVGLIWAQSPVARHGKLSVSGSQIRDEKGNVVQLRGVSLFWSQWEDGAPFYNADVVNYLADNWNISVIRCAMAADQGGWISNRGEADKVRAVVNAAIAKGIYVIIDWHTHSLLTEDAKTFFGMMSKEFGNQPHVIYEIFNEPINQTWTEVKNYAQQVINVIRANDPDNLIIVGTPQWSQDVDIAASDKLAGTNIAYTLHFYAGSHGAWLRDKAQSALGNSAALFVTEWGTTHSDGGTQDRKVYTAESDTWLNWLDQRNISWVNWSVTAKNEASAILKAGASTRGGWTDAQLTESGLYVKRRLLSYPSVRAPASSSSASGSSSSVSTGALDMYGLWGVYVDSLGSRVQPPQGESPLSGTGSAQKARADMTIVAEPEWKPNVVLKYPYIGMFVEFSQKGALANSTSITLRYKSKGNIRMGFMQTGISEQGNPKQGQEWGYHLLPSDTLTTVNIPFSYLEQPSWIEEMTPLDKSAVYGIKFELRPVTTGPTTGYIEIVSMSFDRWSSVEFSEKLWSRLALRGRELLLPHGVGPVRIQFRDLRGRVTWVGNTAETSIRVPESAGIGWRQVRVFSDQGVFQQALMLAP